MESGDSWLSLLDENPFVQRKKIEAEEKGLEEGLQQGLQQGLQRGLQEGRQEGRTEGLQEAVVAVIEGRFPPLLELAHQRVARINKPELLSVLLRQVAAARDEDMARFVLDSFAA